MNDFIENKSVSVCMITYGHESYVAQAIEGVLEQICGFTIELVVVNDCSPDNTDEVIKRIIQNHPKGSLIRYFKHENNIGMMPNFIFALQQCKGKYIALCEGDDYWTDPLKLQKQVDFLESNPEYVLCFHKVEILKSSGELVDDFITKVPESHENIEDLARLGNYIHTPSVVFRNVIQEFPPEFALTPIGDCFLYMLLAEHGKLKYLTDKMSVYREGVGIWSDKSMYFRNFNTALLHANLYDYFSAKDNPVIKEILLNRIIIFIKNFESQISKDDLTLLCSNKVIRNSILDVILTNVEYLKSKSIDNKTIGELIVVIFKRAKKRLQKV